MKKSFEEIMGEFKQLEPSFQQMVRNCAALELKTWGVEEIGSSTPEKPEDPFACFLRVMQNAYEADPVAMVSLIRNRVPCSQKMAANTPIQVQLERTEAWESHTVGMLGVINGICKELTGRMISAIITESADKENTLELEGFTEHLPDSEDTFLTEIPEQPNPHVIHVESIGDYRSISYWINKERVCVAEVIAEDRGWVIDRICTEPGWRKKGYAKALIQKIVELSGKPARALVISSPSAGFWQRMQELGLALPD
jgi:GNAT superfamily N-acetyltransferase